MALRDELRALTPSDGDVVSVRPEAEDAVEVADATFGYLDDRGSRHEAVGLFVHEDRTFSVGSFGSSTSECFLRHADAVARCAAFVRDLRLTPKVWRRRP